MKKVFRLTLVAIIMAVFSTAVSAQANNAAQNNKKQRMSREQMAEAQAKHIARELALDDATSQDGNKEAKQKINKIIREIDNCITLLKK